MAGRFGDSGDPAPRSRPLSPGPRDDWRPRGAGEFRRHNYYNDRPPRDRFRDRDRPRDDRDRPRDAWDRDAVGGAYERDGSYERDGAWDRDGRDDWQDRDYARGRDFESPGGWDRYRERDRSREWDRPRDRSPWNDRERGGDFERDWDRRRPRFGNADSFPDDRPRRTGSDHSLSPPRQRMHDRPSLRSSMERTHSDDRSPMYDSNYMSPRHRARSPSPSPVPPFIPPPVTSSVPPVMPTTASRLLPTHPTSPVKLEPVAAAAPVQVAAAAVDASAGFGEEDMDISKDDVYVKPEVREAAPEPVVEQAPTRKLPTRAQILAGIEKLDNDIMQIEARLEMVKNKKRSNADGETDDVRPDQSDAPKLDLLHRILAENQQKSAKQVKLILTALMKDVPNFTPGVPMYTNYADVPIVAHVLEKAPSLERHVLDHAAAAAFATYNKKIDLVATYRAHMESWTERLERLERRRESESKNSSSSSGAAGGSAGGAGSSALVGRAGRRPIQRDTVRSEEEMQQILMSLLEQERDNPAMRHVHTLAKIPDMILDDESRAFRFFNTNGYVDDPLPIERERKQRNPWTEREKQIFVDNYIIHPKDFRRIAGLLENKSVNEVVLFYYLNKKALKLKRRARMAGPKRRAKQRLMEAIGAAPAAADASNVSASTSAVAATPASAPAQEEENSSEVAAQSDAPTTVSEQKDDTKRAKEATPKERKRPTELALSPAPSPAPETNPEKPSDETSSSAPTRWTDAERERALAAFEMHGLDWSAVAAHVGTKSPFQCSNFYRTHKKKLNLEEIVRSRTESPAGSDEKPSGAASSAISGTIPAASGTISGNMSSIPSISATLAPTKSKGRSSRRATNWTPEEEAQLLSLIAEHGRNWPLLGSLMPSKTEAQLRGFYHALKARLASSSGDNPEAAAMLASMAAAESKTPKRRRRSRQDDAQRSAAAAASSPTLSQDAAAAAAAVLMMPITSSVFPPVRLGSNYTTAAASGADSGLHSLLQASQDAAAPDAATAAAAADLLELLQPRLARGHVAGMGVPLSRVNSEGMEVDVVGIGAGGDASGDASETESARDDDEEEEMDEDMESDADIEGDDDDDEGRKVEEDDAATSEDETALKRAAGLAQKLSAAVAAAEKNESDVKTEAVKEEKEESADVEMPDAPEHVSVTEQVTEKVTEQVTEQVSAQVTDQVSEQVSKPETETVTETVSVPVSVPVTEPTSVSEPASVPVTEQKSESSEKAPVTDHVPADSSTSVSRDPAVTSETTAPQTASEAVPEPTHVTSEAAVTSASTISTAESDAIAALTSFLPSQQ